MIFAFKEVTHVNAFEVLNLKPTASREEIRKAYRELARRWHPDRFMEGPEREWANDKMAQINAAYRECMDGEPAKTAAMDDTARLQQVQRLMDDGKYLSARHLLMSFTTRCAEWNYLFGAVLMCLRETEKALIYLSVAVHQNPANVKYARALNEARGACQSGMRARFSRRKG